MYHKRIQPLQNLLRKEAVDAFFITNFYNIFYLTGFRTLSPHEREAYLLVTRKNVYVFTDGRYIHQLEFQITNNKFTNQLQNSNIKIKQISAEMGLIKHLQEIVDEEQIKTLGFEGEDMRFSEYFLLRKAFQIKLIPFDRIVLIQRVVKTHDEIAKITKACEIGDQCLTDISKLIQGGVSEKEIAWKIEEWLRTKNYELSFDPIVAVDANAALAHYDTKSGKGRVKHDSVVLIDFGVKYQDYCSDITRMFFMKDVSDEIKKTYSVLKTAQQQTVQQLEIGKKLKDIDLFCRRLITSNQYPNYSHSTGHGIGLEVHEYPKVSSQSMDVVTANQVFTIEPGIYVAGKWGMRVEDTVTVTLDGRVDILTKYSKETLPIK